MKQNESLIEQRLREVATVMRSTLLSREHEFREEHLDYEKSAGQVKAFEAVEKRELAGIVARPSRSAVRETRLALGFILPSWDDTAYEK